MPKFLNVQDDHEQDRITLIKEGQDISRVSSLTAYSPKKSINFHSRTRSTYSHSPSPSHSSLESSRFNFSVAGSSTNSRSLPPVPLRTRRVLYSQNRRHSLPLNLLTQSPFASQPNLLNILSQSHPTAYIVHCLRTGFVAWKHHFSSRHAPQLRRIYCNHSLSQIYYNKDSYIPAMNICRVAKGCESRAFIESDHSPVSSRCLSLITDSRSIDIEFPNMEARDEWYIAFAWLLELCQQRLRYCVYQISLTIHTEVTENISYQQSVHSILDTVDRVSTNPEFKKAALPNKALTIQELPEAVKAARTANYDLIMKNADSLLLMREKIDQLRYENEILMNEILESETRNNRQPLTHCLAPIHVDPMNQPLELTL